MATAGVQLPADQSSFITGQGNSKDTWSHSTLSLSTKQPSGTLYIKIPGQCNPQNIPATVAAHLAVIKFVLWLKMLE